MNHPNSAENSSQLPSPPPPSSSSTSKKKASLPSSKRNADSNGVGVSLGDGNVTSLLMSSLFTGPRVGVIETPPPQPPQQSLTEREKADNDDEAAAATATPAAVSNSTADLPSSVPPPASSAMLAGLMPPTPPMSVAALLERFFTSGIRQSAAGDTNTTTTTTTSSSSDSSPHEASSEEKEESSASSPSLPPASLLPSSASSSSSLQQILLDAEALFGGGGVGSLSSATQRAHEAARPPPPPPPPLPQAEANLTNAFASLLSRGGGRSDDGANDDNVVNGNVFGGNVTNNDADDNAMRQMIASLRRDTLAGVLETLQGILNSDASVRRSLTTMATNATTSAADAHDEGNALPPSSTISSTTPLSAAEVLRRAAEDLLRQQQQEGNNDTSSSRRSHQSPVGGSVSISSAASSSGESEGRASDATEAATAHNHSSNVENSAPSGGCHGNVQSMLAAAMMAPLPPPNPLSSSTSPSRPSTCAANASYLHHVLSTPGHTDRPAALAVLTLQAAAARSALVVQNQQRQQQQNQNSGNDRGSSRFAGRRVEGMIMNADDSEDAASNTSTSNDDGRCSRSSAPLSLLLRGIASGVSPFDPSIVPPADDPQMLLLIAAVAGGGGAGGEQPRPKRTLLNFPSSSLSSSASLTAGSGSELNPPLNTTSSGGDVPPAAASAAAPAEKINGNDDDDNAEDDNALPTAFAPRLPTMRIVDTDDDNDDDDAAPASFVAAGANVSDDGDVCDARIAPSTQEEEGIGAVAAPALLSEPTVFGVFFGAPRVVVDVSSDASPTSTRKQKDGTAAVSAKRKSKQSDSLTPSSSAAAAAARASTASNQVAAAIASPPNAAQGGRGNEHQYHQHQHHQYCFYRTRDQALSERGYFENSNSTNGVNAGGGDVGGNAALIVLAADKATLNTSSSSGNSVNSGQKVFDVMALPTRMAATEYGETAGEDHCRKISLEPLKALLRIGNTAMNKKSSNGGIASLPSAAANAVMMTGDARRRNLYVVVDPGLPARPFFDIDVSEWKVGGGFGEEVREGVGGVRGGLNTRQDVINTLLVQPLLNLFESQNNESISDNANAGDSNNIAAVSSSPSSPSSSSSSLFSWTSPATVERFKRSAQTAEVLTWLTNLILQSAVEGYFSAGMAGRGQKKKEGGDRIDSSSSSSPRLLVVRPTIFTSSTPIVVEKATNEDGCDRFKLSLHCHYRASRVEKERKAEATACDFEDDFAFLSLDEHRLFVSEFLPTLLNSEEDELDTATAALSPSPSPSSSLSVCLAATRARIVSRVTAAVKEGLTATNANKKRTGADQQQEGNDGEGDAEDGRWLKEWEQSLMDWFASSSTAKEMQRSEDDDAVVSNTEEEEADGEANINTQKQKKAAAAVARLLWTLVEEVVDRSIYSRWRPFRLPFNTKLGGGGGAGFENDAVGAAMFEAAAIQYKRDLFASPSAGSSVSSSSSPPTDSPPVMMHPALSILASTVAPPSPLPLPSCRGGEEGEAVNEEGGQRATTMASSYLQQLQQHRFLLPLVVRPTATTSPSTSIAFPLLREALLLSSSASPLSSTDNTTANTRGQMMNIVDDALLAALIHPHDSNSKRMNGKKRQRQTCAAPFPSSPSSHPMPVRRVLLPMVQAQYTRLKRGVVKAFEQAFGEDITLSGNDEAKARQQRLKDAMARLTQLQQQQEKEKNKGNADGVNTIPPANNEENTTTSHSSDANKRTRAASFPFLFLHQRLAHKLLDEQFAFAMSQLEAEDGVAGGAGLGALQTISQNLSSSSLPLLPNGGGSNGALAVASAGGEEALAAHTRREKSVSFVAAFGKLRKFASAVEALLPIEAEAAMELDVVAITGASSSPSRNHRAVPTIGAKRSQCCDEDGEDMGADNCDVFGRGETDDNDEIDETTNGKKHSSLSREVIDNGSQSSESSSLGSETDDEDDDVFSAPISPSSVLPIVSYRPSMAQRAAVLMDLVQNKSVFDLKTQSEIEEGRRAQQQQHHQATTAPSPRRREERHLNCFNPFGMPRCVFEFEGGEEEQFDLHDSHQSNATAADESDLSILLQLADIEDDGGENDNANTPTAMRGTIAHTLVTTAAVNGSAADKEDADDAKGQKTTTTTAMTTSNTMLNDGNPRHPFLSSYSSLPRSVIPPPIPSGKRIAITDRAIRSVLSEVFRCLHPHFDDGVGGGDGRAMMMTTSSSFSSSSSSPILPTNLSACQYEDNGCFRSYYVSQRVNRFCLKLHRHHKHTYGQLFLTYDSIKYRCYSNDCFEKCLAVRWKEEAAVAAGAGVSGVGSAPLVASSSLSSSSYPRFHRLAQIRQLLFPSLSADELSTRYPWIVQQQEEATKAAAAEAGAVFA